MRGYVLYKNIFTGTSFHFRKATCCCLIAPFVMWMRIGWEGMLLEAQAVGVDALI